MTRRPRAGRLAALVCALLAVAGAACGGGGSDATATTTKSTSRSTTTIVGTTTAPTVPPGPTYPLTGMPVADAAAAARPALVVKIDNAEPRARPQQGLNQADVVYEEMVEGSVTRFAAVFQSTDAVNRVVPVRSARTTDIALFTPLNHPLFAWSGANADFATLIRHSPIVDVGVDAQPGEYHRDHSRSPTHDLYTTTQGLWAHAPAGAVPPPPLFFYRALGQQLPADARPTPHAYVAFGSQVGSAPVDWYWDGGPGVWRRNQRGTPDVDETGQQVSPRNVIIQLVTYHDTGYVDTTGATVFEADLVGSGDCMLLTVGSVVPCRWWKPTPEAVTTYYDSTGAPLLLTPGQTWVELPWAGRAAVNVD